jgi:hypothetical protein
MLKSDSLMVFLSMDLCTATHCILGLGVGNMAQRVPPGREIGPSDWQLDLPCTYD